VERGVYAAAAGGLSSLRMLQVISNNLANVNTVGFKAERLVTRQQEFSDTLASTLKEAPARAPSDHLRTPGVTDIATFTDFTPGPISETGNPLDAALVKDSHFFAVQTAEGEAYTRAGNFTIDANGFLVTPDGYPVLGEGGPISIDRSSAKITSNGTIMTDQNVLGRVRVVEIPDLSQLRRQGGSRFMVEGGAQPANIEDPQLIPQAVEMPNISVVQSMVDLINANRAFESYTKSVRTINELDETALRGARTTG